jgi:hypothetical protein
MSADAEALQPWRLQHAWRSGTDAAALALCREQLAGAGLALLDCADAGTASAVKMHGIELAQAGAAGDPALLDLATLAGRNGWPRRLSPGMQRYMVGHGSWHGIPLGIHRANAAWVNAELRDRVGLGQPMDAADWLRWLSCARAITRYPLAIGGNPLHVGVLFESVLLAVAGAKRYRQALEMQDSAVWSEPAVIAALELLMALRAFVDDAQLAQPWAVQWQRVRSGEAALTIQGDWVRPTAGPAIAEWATPGTAGRFIAIYDFFVPLAGSESLASVRAAMALTDPVFQRGFAQLKGCMPALRDAWAQVDAERALLLADEHAVLPSFTFDQCCPLPRKQSLLDVVCRHFVESRSALDCAQALARAGQ